MRFSFWRTATSSWTIAIRKTTLDQIGGFAAFADRLADDYEIGRTVRGLGLRVTIPPFVVSHSCAEQGVKELLAHELRWARTVYMIDRPGYIGSGISHALPLALIGAAMLGFTPVALGVLAGAAAARLWLTSRVDSAIGAGRGAWRLFVARDLLSFFVYVAAFFVRSVTWRDRRISVEPQRMVAPAKGH
jgi:ceramide glucosyltransferase